MVRNSAFVVAALLAVVPVAAQEVNITNNMAGDFAMIGLQHEVLNRSLGISGNGRPNGYRAAPPRGRAYVGGGAGAGYFAAPARPGPAPAFRYEPSVALRRQALDEYVARIGRQNPAAARTIASEFGKHDYATIYSGLVAPAGIRTNDAADALAAYTILGYMIATGSPDPSPRQAAAVRAQVAQHAVDNPSFGDSRSRAKLGEEMKLLFVTLHAGWQSARREGNLRQYADGVADLFQRSDINLRALRLTDAGFAAR